MAIDTEHDDFAEYKIQWQKCDDCNEGQEAVHKRGKQYLPALSGQDEKDYKAYQTRALFYGATSRTVDGLSGMIFRKEPTIEVPAAMQGMIDDVTLSGMSLLGFAEEIVENSLVAGRAGILVDHPSVSVNTTKAQAEAMNIRPFLKLYEADQIFNWRTETRNNTEVLTQLRLYECVESIGADEFDIISTPQIRILDFNDAGQYRQRVFQKDKKGDWIQFGFDIIPLKNGAPLDRIPFFFVGVRNSSPEIEKPPLIDMANANLSHYVSTADLEHGAHFTGLPTAVITGHTDDDMVAPAEYRIGAATAWIFPNPETKVQYLEFQGQGLEALEKRIARKEEYMAFLGARMLTPEKKAAETAQTAEIHRSGEISVLSSLSIAASKSIESALQFMAEWAGIAGDVKFSLNKEFLTVRMSAQDLTALLQLWQGQGIAYADLLDNLKRAEIVAEDRTEDEIRSEIETQNPFSGQDLTGAGNVNKL